MALQLRDGVTPARAAEQLQSCATQGRNIAGSGGGQQVAIHANLYLAWVNRAEAELRNVFIDPTTWLPLHGEAYWRIRELHEGSARAIELINDEAGRQAERIEAYARQCKRLDVQLTAAPGVLTVLDTNVLLHFEPPAEVNWLEVVGALQVRLVLPLRVIEELDEKKYTGRSDLADRARRLLSQLRSQLAAAAGGPTAIRDGVTIEIPVDDEPRRRTLDADQEVLDVCRQLRSGGQRVVLVTDDTGMTCRAWAQATEVVSMPETYLRNKPPVLGA